MRRCHHLLSGLLMLLAVVFLALTGCTTIRSTHVTKNLEGCGWKTKSLRGVPVTVKLPTQLEIRIIENRYYGAGARDFLRENGEVVKTRHVEYDVREKEEVFTVDLVRPAAGLGDFNTSYKNQFFDKITGKVEDKTIEAITNALGKVTGALGALPKGASASIMGPAAETYQVLPAMLAVRVFDVHDPMLERDVQEFLHLYLNGCRTPGVQPEPLTPTPVCNPK